MARAFQAGLNSTGPGANTSGLSFTRLSSTSPPVQSAPLGVDVAGNVVVSSMPSYRSVLLNNVANPANSTADQAAISATVPAGQFVQGSMFHAQAVGAVQGGNATYNFWVKTGTTKIITVSFQIGLLVAINGYWGLRAFLTCRTTGTSGAFATYLQVLNDASNVIQSQTGTATIDTTQAQAISAGFNWTNAGANNIITATQGIITPM